jgi:hypothetical protein
MNFTVKQFQLVARDIVAAVVLQKCLADALAELEIAIGFRDWNGVRRALELIREGLVDW